MAEPLSTKPVTRTKGSTVLVFLLGSLVMSTLTLAVSKYFVFAVLIYALLAGLYYALWMEDKTYA